MFEKILVPLDGSELAERALKPALRVASHDRSRLFLLDVPVYSHVMVPGAAGYGLITPEESLTQSRKEAQNYLESIVQIYRRPGLAITPLVIDGDIAGTIVDAAADKEVDLIVMTTHGYSGFTRWVMGSVTERVLRSAPCPVLVVRHEKLPTQAVITLDGSRLAERALKPGLHLARSLGAQITLLRVSHEERLSRVEMGMLRLTDSELCKDLTQNAEGRVVYYLDCLAEKYSLPESAVKAVILKGQPAPNILAYLETHNTDLLIMATHGYTGLKRWVYGSVMEKVLRKADCAMLIVRPPAADLQE